MLVKTMDKGDEIERAAVLSVTDVDELAMKGMGVFEPVR